MDMVEIERVTHSLERFGRRFLQKILTPAEEQALDERGLRLEMRDVTKPLASTVAARFAAKEAAVKALGTGFTLGIGMHHIEIHSLPSGQPRILFHGLAAQRMAALGATKAHISLTHSRDSAAAVVILED